MNRSNETIVYSQRNNQYSVQAGNKHYEVNRKGYLINFNDWDRDFTKKVAELDHLKLTELHWEAILFLREFYSEYEAPPSPRIVNSKVGAKINLSGCSQYDIRTVFSSAGCKQACRLAGLPLCHCYVC